MRIAILMLAHKNENQTIRLINRLKTDFDVFVHIDARSPMNIEDDDNVFIFKKYACFWGGIGMVHAELLLMNEAHKKQYDRYVLISAQDLPLMTNAEIIKFFFDNKKEYIALEKVDLKKWRYAYRVTGYNLQDKYRGVKGKRVLRLFNRGIARMFRLWAKIFPKKTRYIYCWGWQWFNLTHKCVAGIFDYLEKDKEYLPSWNHSAVPDEMFFQTLINMIDGLDIDNDYLRYTNWTEGNSSPMTFGITNYRELADAATTKTYLFARKFDEKTDNDIIDEIYALSDTTH